ncbi:MAG: pyruvate, phosphate dikinase [Spirochaetes bacterium]|nr:MAG: pyruvate, phosphate dikinase [Spirochaetota bacterium]
MEKNKYVYFFGGGKAEGNASMKDVLGGKGANLAEMTNLGIPVPPGFTISAEVCDLYYKNNREYPEGLREEVHDNLKKLEELMGKKLGGKDDPLLVSVRSGAAISMPGMMDTILNLGLNDEAVEGLARKTGNERFAWDAYRRLIHMFGNVAKGVPHEEFEEAFEKRKKERGVEADIELEAEDFKTIVPEYKEIFKKHVGEHFPQNPEEQLWEAINAVFGSWENPRAIKYRRLHHITGLLGTAVNVQTMVFGNFGEDSGTGVCFTRDPSTGENIFYGEYLENAQGEDVVAGIRTPKELKTLEKNNPTIYNQLVEIRNKLEKHYRDMQDIEFTTQQGKLYILQTRTGKRTGPAAVKCAVDMVKENLINKEEAIARISPEELDQLLHPMIDPKDKKNLDPIAKGLNASPGAANGQVVFTAEDAEKWARDGKKVLLVRRETSPEDIGGMSVASGILTSTGGMTSHAAVVARGMGKPCVAGCRDVSISGKVMSIGDKNFEEGSWITIDGSTGEVYEGQISLKKPSLSGELGEFLTWADEIRKEVVREGVDGKGYLVRTNADQPEDAKIARSFGAEGIGLCRTEHMFFGEGKLEIFQEMIVAEDDETRAGVLKKLMPLQKEDFKGIFRAMDGYPVTIRLLDPPLHEFVPKTGEEVKQLAGKLNLSEEKLTAKIQSLHELNPMLGHRGCRLGVTYPAIYDMQVEAIITAACEVAKEGVKVLPEIMIPLVGTYQELKILRENAEKVISKVFKEKGTEIEYKIGTMIEIPRASLTADEIAEYADFFSFGTNDLTQMTFGFSRDDVGSFVPHYLEQNILEKDPFMSIDERGVGQLVEMGVKKGRSAKKDLKIGICGEHGGESSSIDFCYRTGLNYVSCSPYRVPLARLSAAQAVLRHRGVRF